MVKELTDGTFEFKSGAIAQKIPKSNKYKIIGTTNRKKYGKKQSLTQNSKKKNSIKKQKIQKRKPQNEQRKRQGAKIPLSSPFQPR